MLNKGDCLPSNDQLDCSSIEWMLIPHNAGRPTTWTWPEPPWSGLTPDPDQACHLDLVSPEPPWPCLPSGPGQSRTTLARPVGLARPATWTWPGPNHVFDFYPNIYSRPI